MLGVQDTVELYTTLLGWSYYQKAWQMLVQTGLIFMPFIGMIIANSLKPYESQAAKEATLTALRRIEVDTVSMLCVILLACTPYMPLNLRVLHSTPTQAIGKPGDTQTTYDGILPIPNGVKVPLLWYGVMSVAEGLTAAMKETVGDVPNLRALITQVQLARITDPGLQRGVEQFYQQCYLPARTTFLQTKQQLTRPAFNARFRSYIKKYGATDMEWLGSHAFSTLPGYYDQHNAAQPVVGFAFDPLRDWQAAQVGNPPPWGQPNCVDWWWDKRTGLRTQLLNQIPVYTQFHLMRLFRNKEQFSTQLLQSLLLHHQTARGYAGANTLVSHWGLSHLAETIGIEMSQLTSYPKLYAIQQAAPVVRALLLLLLYAFLPLGLIFSRYRVRALVTGSIFLFSLIFWSFIWTVVQWIDQALIQALYGNWFFKQTPQATLVDTLISILMVLAPLFWFTVMGVLGVNVGQGLDRFTSSLFGPTQAAAAKGSDMLQSSFQSKNDTNNLMQETSEVALLVAE